MHWLAVFRRLVTGFTVRRSQFNQSAIYMGFVVNTVIQDQVSLRVYFGCPLPVIVTPMLKSTTGPICSRSTKGLSLSRDSNRALYLERYPLGDELIT
jgi:hypothetical protein